MIGWTVEAENHCNGPRSRPRRGRRATCARTPRWLSPQRPCRVCIHVQGNAFGNHSAGLGPPTEHGPTRKSIGSIRAGGGCWRITKDALFTLRMMGMRTKSRTSRPADSGPDGAVLADRPGRYRRPEVPVKRKPRARSVIQHGRWHRMANASQEVSEGPHVGPMR